MDLEMHFRKQNMNNLEKFNVIINLYINLRI